MELIKEFYEKQKLTGMGKLIFEDVNNAYIKDNLGRILHIQKLVDKIIVYDESFCQVFEKHNDFFILR